MTAPTDLVSERQQARQRAQMLELSPAIRAGGHLVLQLRDLGRLQPAEDVRPEIAQSVGAPSIHVAPFQTVKDVNLPGFSTAAISNYVMVVASGSVAQQGAPEAVGARRWRA